MDLFMVDTTGNNALLHTDQDQDDIKYNRRTKKESEIQIDENAEDSSEDEQEEENEKSEDDEEYNFGGKFHQYIIFLKKYSTFPFWTGLPPPSVDVLAILRNPLLYTEPLYGVKEEKSQESNEFEAFCKAMGWTIVDGTLRKKPENESINGWKVEDMISLENVHGDWAKADVKKEMINSQTKGIERLRSIEKISDRKAAQLRRVNTNQFYVYVNFSIWWNIRHLNNPFSVIDGNR